MARSVNEVAALPDPLGKQLDATELDEGLTLYKRLALIAERRRIVKVFYPVFPPDRNAEEVVAWLAS